MDVYFVRHGESEGNAYHIHSGWGPYPLTGKGREQAAATGAHIRNIPFDRIFVSDLARTQETAGILFPDRRAEFTLVEEIREYNSPVVGRTFADMEAQYGEEYFRMRRELDYSAIGGETPSHFYERVSVFMRRLEALEGCERVAVVCHAGVLRNIAQYVLDVPYRDDKVATGNCAVSVLRWRDSVWKLRVWNWTPELAF